MNSTGENMFNIGFNDLVRFLKALDFDEFTANVVADYLDECIDFEFDLSGYVWNTLLFSVEVFHTKDEALQYIEDNLGCSVKDCKIYEGNFGTYLEWG